MRIKILLIFSTIFSCSFNPNQKLYETLETKAADILISLSNKDYSYKLGIENLKYTLFQKINPEDLEKIYRTTLDEYDGLKESFFRI